MTRRRLLAWTGVAAVVIGLAIPWFLWGNRTTVVGVPIWVWWHAAWLLLSAVVFYRFATTTWGLGIERPESGAAAATGSEARADSSGGERGGGPGGEAP